ncbi:HlyD family secretion protein [Novosphingobium sp. 9U]|uniref:HlyD family secretion protein n=1 Tax=Novosphingobium sp. 9U TaxID=2653158 RepID=UPI0012F028D2|nr:HlyD family secretion protein [Novosphingobium sp. 9U]VWX46736.1 MFS multidrug efflux pump, A subunit [Novosphingobium sp. 9U]
MADDQQQPHTQVDHQPDEDREEGAQRRSLSPRTKLILLVVAVLLLVGGGIWFFRHKTYGQFFQETNDATIMADAVSIAPRVNGYVAQVMVLENQDVAVGQPLLRIDARNYQAQVDQARAQIAQADASADNARASISEQQAAIAQAEAQLAAARSKAAHDAAEVARYVPLAASGAETRQQLAQLRLAATQSAQQVRELAAGLEIQRRKITGIQTQIRQAQAQAQGGRAQLASAQVDVGGALLKAPVAGRVGDKTVTPGQYVQAGTRLMSLVPLDQLYVVANFKETQLALMRPGQPAKIAVDALSGTELDGKVLSISPGTGAQFSILPPQNATGNFTKIVQRVPVRIAITAPPAARKLLVPGLSVTVTVDTRGAKGELDRIEEQQERLEKQGR